MWNKTKITSLRMRVTVITSMTLMVICLLLSGIILKNVDTWIIYPTTMAESEEGQTLGNSVFPTSPPSMDPSLLPPDNTEEIMIAQNVNSFYWSTLFALLAILVMGIVAIYFVVGYSLKPLDRLRKRISELDGADLDQRIEEGSKCSELDALAMSFNQLFDRLQVAFEREKTFSAGAAHELKTPLATLKTNLDVLALSEEPTQEEYQETIAIIQKQSERMSLLIDDLFAMYSNSDALHFEAVNIERLVQVALNELQPQAQAKDIEVVVSSSPLMVQANPNMLKQALGNVIQNAIKYNVPKGKVRIVTLQRDNQCVIHIEDEGMGISAQAAPHIFEPFYREDPSRSKQLGGVGLGLSITQNIMKQHGGSIAYAPNVLKGACFVLTVPLAVKR